MSVSAREWRGFVKRTICSEQLFINQAVAKCTVVDRRIVKLTRCAEALRWIGIVRVIVQSMADGGVKGRACDLTWT